jgi:putative glutamine amidotransferase
VLAVSQAGACPLLIPPSLSDVELNTLVQRLDGVLFSGGGDIDPVHYGVEPHPKVGEVDPDRDRVELHLLHKVVQQAFPFLGICRGLQLVNVGLDGTLYADIHDQ